MKYVGENTVRVDGFDKVTGRAKYVDDYSADGMLYAVVVRSTIAHAKILSVDTTQLSKDAFVFTAKDLKNNVIVDIINDRPVFADEKVRFYGEAICVVASTTLNKAKEESKKIKIEYEPLPVYLDAEEAIKEGATVINGESNLISTFNGGRGNVDDGFKKADLIIEHTFTTPNQEHAYMEPDANFSYYDGEMLTVISSSQNVFADKNMIVHALGIDENKVKVTSATVGGAFGGKDGHMSQIFGTLVTYKTGKPCKIVFDRQESIAYTFKRHSAKMHVKIGFKNDGKIVSFEANNIVDTGAYIGYGFSVQGLLSEHIPGPYNIENVKVSTILAYTNKTPSSAFRGFGAPQANFATESILDEAAVKLNIDPVDLRLKNALKQGDIGPFNQKIDHTCGLIEALTIFKNSDFWKNKEVGDGIGYGVSAGHLSCGFGKGVPDKAEVLIKELDGGFEVYLGFTEIGQGAVQSLRQITANALDVDIEKIKMIMGDTEKTYNCASTAASRSTYLGGNAILKAVEEYKKKKALGEKNIEVRSTVEFPENENMVTIGVPHSLYTFGVQGFKVKVDKVTGEVKVLDVLAVTEAGKIMNPMQFNGQISGAILQSLGLALSEGIIYGNDGRILNDTFSTYIIPTAIDAPNITSLFVDGFEPSGPNGVKGAAEYPTVPTCAGINSAIHSATGKWHYSLPITKQKIIGGGKEL